MMRRNYIYAIAILMMSLAIWFGYYLYLEYKPVSYKNGTFVEVPKHISMEIKELSA